jgi:hypothetical protein
MRSFLVLAADSVCELIHVLKGRRLGTGQQKVGNLLRRVDHQPVPRLHREPNPIPENTRNQRGATYGPKSEANSPN